MTTSPYFYSGCGLPLVDDPEKFCPQLWKIKFELQTAFWNIVHIWIANNELQTALQQPIAGYKNIECGQGNLFSQTFKRSASHHYKI